MYARTLFAAHGRTSSATGRKSTHEEVLLEVEHQGQGSTRTGRRTAGRQRPEHPREHYARATTSVPASGR
eukprot:11591826-Alexandrium_andersonii.AAC.1